MIAGLSNQPPRTLDELLGPTLAARLERLDLLSRKILAGKLPGERRSKRRGRSVEFDDFRQYVPGDDLRHIDWNIVARLDRLVVKLFREEEDLALNLVVDASASMAVGDPDKLVYAHRLAMALAYVGLVNQNRVTLATFGAQGGEGFRQLAPMRGRGSVRRVSGFLLESLGESSRGGRSAGRDGAGDPAAGFARAMRLVARARAGRGITVVISDFLIPGGPAAGLAVLGAAAVGGTFDTYCVQTLSPGEFDPARETARGLIGDLRLTDVESGKGAEVTVTPASIAVYRRNFAVYQDELRAECLKRGIAHFLVLTETPVEELVMGSLRRGGLLR